MSNPAPVFQPVTLERTEGQPASSAPPADDVQHALLRPTKLSIALALILLALVTRFWLAPGLELLPGHYVSETNYSADCHFRDRPDGAWDEFQLVARRRDQALINSGEHLMVQSDMHWIGPGGVVTFEALGIYGVDRSSRQNLSGYGNVTRGGQFLFPPHVEQRGYMLWDPFYSEARTATFERSERLNGAEVYVFKTVAAATDDTVGYKAIAGVGTRYRALSDGTGTVWVDPRSGIVIDHEDAGVSYFVDATTGVRLADFYFWDSRYTAETKAAQLRLARRERFRMRTLEWWLPALMAAGAIALLLPAGVLRRADAEAHQ